MKDPQNTEQQLFRMALFSIILVSAILQGCPRDLLIPGSNYSGSSGYPGSSGYSGSPDYSGSSGRGDGGNGGGSGSRTGPSGGLSGPVDASGPSGPVYKPAPDEDKRKGPSRDRVGNFSGPVDASAPSGAIYKPAPEIDVRKRPPRDKPVDPRKVKPFKPEVLR